MVTLGELWHTKLTVLWSLLTPSVDTYTSPPICCQLPRYGIHDSKVMTDQIEAPIAWGSMILFAPKPHQEDVVDVKDLCGVFV